MSKWINNFWQRCLLTVDEATSKTQRAFEPTSKASTSQQRSTLESLESRILFSAAPIDAGALQDTTETVATIESNADSEQSDQNQRSDSQTSSTSEIIIVDGNVDSIDQFLDDLSRSGRDVEVFVLDTNEDGIDQITQILDGRTGVDSLHIVSHGSPGNVTLGNLVLHENNLAGYAGQIASWSGALSSDADVLFYGCDLASDTAGQQLVASLSALTGADVAASIDTTGHESLGGNWTLEYGVGVIETELPFSTRLQSEWIATLPANTAPVNVGPYVGRTAENTSLTFQASTANGFSVDDSDSGTSDLEITLTIANGTISLGDASAITILQGTGTNDVTTTFRGTLTEVNTALDGLQFDPTAGFVGRAELTMLSDDLGTGTGTGGALTDTNVYAIQVGQELTTTGEIQVNPTSPEDPTDSSETLNGDIRGSRGAVATHDDGSYVVVWTDDNRNDAKDVFAQRFDSTGTKIGTSFQVNAFDAGDQSSASVAMDGQGRFAVVWTSFGQDGTDNGIFMRRFNADGSAIDVSDVQVNATDFDETASTLAANDAGQIVVTWQSKNGGTEGIFANTFDMSGGAGAGEFQVVSSANASSPDVDINDAGDFVIVWQDAGIWRRRYGSQADAGATQVHTDGSTATADPVVAYQNDGRFLIVWTSLETNNSLRFQGFEANGAGGNVSSMDVGILSTFSFRTSLDSDHEGNYLLAWEQFNGSQDIAVMRLAIDSSTEVQSSSRVLVNTSQANARDHASISMNDTENFVVVWSGEGAADTDGVLARQFGSALQESFAFTAAGAGDTPSVTFDTGDVLVLTGPSLEFEPESGTTAGDLSSIFDSFDFSDPDIGIDGLHLISRDIVIGSGANSVQLLKGDYLISMASATDIGSLSVQDNDILVLRPNFVGEYGVASVGVLFDDISRSGSTQVNAFTLVEQDTQIGDVTVSAGDLLFQTEVLGDNDDEDIWVWNTGNLGEGQTSGTVEKLIDGRDVNIDRSIAGLELIEVDSEIGGTQLAAGSLVISLESAADVGDNSVNIKDEHAFVLELTTTTLGAGTTAGDAYLFFEGDDIDFRGGDEDVNALTLVATPTVIPNVAPTLVTSSQNPTYTEGNSGTALFSSTNVDAGNSGDEIVSILLNVSGLQNGSDELFQIDGQSIAIVNGTAITTTNNGFNVSVSVTGSSAAVTISKATGFDETAAATLIDTLLYQNTSNDPLGSTREIAINQIRDDGGTSSGVDNSDPNVTSTVSIAAINDEPVLVASGSNLDFSEGDSATTVFSATSLDLVESGDEVALIEFTVTGVQEASQEFLTIDGEQLNLTDGTNTSVGGVVTNISTSGSTITVSVTKPGDLTAAEALNLIGGLQYQHQGDDPTEGTRSLTLTVIQDSGGAAGTGDNTANPNTATNFNVSAINDEPVIIASGIDQTFIEGNGATTVFSATSLDLVESDDKVALVEFTVTGVQEANQEFVTIDGEEFDLTDGNDTTVSGVAVNIATAGTTITVSLTTAADLTATEAFNLISGLQYQHKGTDPTEGVRNLTLTVIQDDGGTANSGDDTANPNVASNITIAAVNQAPTITANGLTPNYVENSSGSLLFDTVDVDLSEPSDLVQSITLTINGLLNGSEEILEFAGTDVALTDGNNVSAGGFDFVVGLAGTTATVEVTRTGNYSATQAESLLGGLTYKHSGDDPTVGSRSISITEIQDNGGTANSGDDTTTFTTLVSNVGITPVNDAPTVSAIPENQAFTENGSPVNLFNTAVVDLGESGDLVAGIQFQITNLQDGANEFVRVDGQNIALTDGTTTNSGIVVDVVLAGGIADVRVAKTGGFSVADAQTLINTIGYSNQSENPTGTSRTAIIDSIRDDGTTLNGGVNETDVNIVSTFSIVKVNDAPTVASSALAPVSVSDTDPLGATVDSLFGIGFSDVDGDTLSGLVVVGNTATAASGRWQYSSDGTNWFDVGSVSESTGLVVSATSRLRFLPNTVGVPDSLSVRGLDSSYTNSTSDTSAGESRVTLDTSSPTVTDPFSSATVDLSTEVFVSNQPPQLSGTVDQSISDSENVTPFPSITIADADGNNLSVVISLSGGDNDGEFTSTSLAAAGFTKSNVGEYTLITPTSSASVQASLRLLEFLPTANLHSIGTIQSTQFTITLSDGIASVTDNGTDVNALSVNDSPIIASTDLNAIAEDTTNPAGQRVDALLNASFDDPDVGSNLSGIVVVGNSADSKVEGVWQYSSDGANWSDIGNVSTVNGLAISASSRLRFVPFENFNGTPRALAIHGVDGSFPGSFSDTTGVENRKVFDVSTNTPNDAVSDSPVTVGIEVVPVNDAPTLRRLTRTTAAGNVLEVGPTPFQNRADDVDGDVLTAHLVGSGPENGTLTLNSDGSFKYVPDEGFVGTDLFVWRAFDGTEFSPARLVIINVQPGIPAPESEGDSAPSEPDDTSIESEEENENDSEDNESENESGEPLPTSSGAAPSGSATAPNPSPLASVVSITEANDDDDRISIFFNPVGVGEIQRSRESISEDSSQRASVEETKTLQIEYGSSGSISTSDYALISAPGEMWRELDSARSSLEEQLQKDMMKIGTTGIATSGFTVGFVAWALRSGFLISGFLAQMPAWRSIDPLLIMQGMGNFEGEESLEDIMQQESDSLD